MSRARRCARISRGTSAAAPLLERRPFALLPAGILLLGVLAGCGRSEEAPAAGGEVGSENVEDVSPLSREQLELQAEAMSPEVAESLGIVDTTIRIERPIPRDSLLLPGIGLDSLPRY